jgi:enoyl-CoA hydratase
MVCMDKPVHVRREGAVTLITLNRPARRNAVDAATAQALYEAFAAFDADPQASVAVLHGAHGHFCAGWDLQSGAAMLKGADADTAAHALAAELDFDPNDCAPPGPLGPLGPSRLTLGKPVIAAMAGAAVAGGLELALWCDLRVMEADAYVGVYCRRFGVPLVDGGTVRLPRIVGMGRALDMILTGRRVDATEALAMGLCTRVVPAGQSLAGALELAQALCQLPQATMRADRASAYAQWDLPMHEALHQEWQRGKARLGDALQGATHFAGGAGRHGGQALG